MKKITILSSSLLLLSLAACQENKQYDIKSKNLMANLTANVITSSTLDDDFKGIMTDFSIKTFKSTIDKRSNTLVSPLSIMEAISMTSNGADNETKTELEGYLGCDVDSINKYLYSYNSYLTSNTDIKLNIANSIWLRNTPSFKANDKFLQVNADYYKADAYLSDFDKTTINDINKWVSNNTDKMIDRVIDDINPNTIMYLINTILFDGQWQKKYTKASVSDASFNNYNGSNSKIKMMSSLENKYLESENATGFIKPYTNRYSFMALLPNEGIDLYDYVNALTKTEFVDILNNYKTGDVYAKLPKFKYDYSFILNEVIKKEAPLAFDSVLADFSNIGKSSNNIYIGNVNHKTSIEVAEQGTKAGAMTIVYDFASAKPQEEIKKYYVTLDRPFIYSIIDDEYNLPIFMGTVSNLAG